MDVELVIARYSENVDWVKDVNINTTIYNKTSELDYNVLKGNKKEFNIVKVEKEMFKGPSHSYCIHLHNNYHKLKKNTIFLQARPWDHLHNLIKKIKGKEEADNYHALHMIRNAEDEVKLRANCEKIFINYLNSLEHQPDEEFFSLSMIHKDGAYMDLQRKILDKCNLPIMDLNSFPIGEQFIVSREKIQDINQHTYKDFIFWHENGHPANDFICNRTIAYVMERLWFNIFNYKVNL